MPELKLRVEKATNLKNTDTGILGDLTDCAVKINWEGHEVKTRCISNNLNPEWKEDLLINVTDTSGVIHFLLYDAETFKPDNLFGVAWLNLCHLRQNVPLKLQLPVLPGNAILFLEAVPDFNGALTTVEEDLRKRIEGEAQIKNEEIKKQIDDLRKQSEDNKRQTDDLRKQNDDLRKQTDDLRKQTEDNKRQTDDLRKQTEGKAGRIEILHAANAHNENPTSDSNWMPIDGVTTSFKLLQATDIEVLAHGHAIAYHHDRRIDVGIFVDDKLVGMDQGTWERPAGMALTHNPDWVPAISVANVRLNAGDHVVNLRISSRWNGEVRLNNSGLTVKIFH